MQLAPESARFGIFAEEILKKPDFEASKNPRDFDGIPPVRCVSVCPKIPCRGSELFGRGPDDLFKKSRIHEPDFSTENPRPRIPGLEQFHMHISNAFENVLLLYSPKTPQVIIIPSSGLFRNG